jgi:hypothetical protein
VYALALGANEYSQLYAAVDDVYLYPGSSGGLNITTLLPILLVLLFFYLLYRFTRRGRRSSREMLKLERIIETPTQDKVQFRRTSPPVTMHEISEEAENGQEKGS